MSDSFHDSLDAARERAGFAPALGDGTEEYAEKAAVEPSADVEALAEVIVASVLIPGPLKFGSHEGLVLTHSEAMRPARAILASDWLAAHTAAARAEGAQAVLDAVERMVAEWGEVVPALDPPAYAVSILAAAREAARNAGAR